MMNRYEHVYTADLPRILIGATGSGSGKTTVVCGILTALKNRGIKTVSFKCGPDYIDPMFHREVLGIPATNLDLFFNDGNTISFLISEHMRQNNAQIGIIEGVMGYYDGLGGISHIASSHHLSMESDTPSVLVVDGRGKSLSILAEIKGFLEFESNNIKGIIINKISPMTYALLKPLIEERLDIKVLGFLPKMDDISLESRHLGLVTAKEVENLDCILAKLGESAEKHLDIDGILELSNEAANLIYEDVKIKREGDVKIAVAMDKAFSFYYDSNLRLLEKMGAKLVYFSPLADDRLPADIDALILGGGYPELYLNELSNNCTMAEDIKSNIENEMPALAECGGFMYLHDLIEDERGKKYRGVGVIKGTSYYTGKLGRFGYVDVEMKKRSVLGNAGIQFKAHEFHYWDSENCGDSATAKKPLRNKSWDCIVGYKKLLAGYPHIHYYSNIDMMKNFIAEAKRYREKRIGETAED